MRLNLNDPAERGRYRAELLALKRGWRVVGVLLCCGGVAALLYDKYEGAPALRWPAWGAIAVGLALFAYVIAFRTRYHRARMAEDQAT